MPTPLAVPSRLQGLSQAAVRDVIATAQALDGGAATDAARQLAGVLAAHPSHPEVLRLHAGIESLRGRHEQAMHAMRLAIAARPSDALYQNTFGTVFAQAGEYDMAILALRRCCELQPDYAVAWYNLGVTLTRCVRYDEAAAALRKAVELTPDHLAARAQLADMLRVSDNATEAAAEYRAILAADPLFGAAWWGLAELKTWKFLPGDVERMQAALRDANASTDDRVATGFALAKALDDEERYAESLAALEQANAIARERRRWDADAFAQYMANVRATCAKSSAAVSAGLGQQVVFVVSLPRSGSTLIEQILASHASVEGAGELPDVPLVIGEESQRRRQPFPQWFPAMQPADWNRLGQRYLDRTAHWTRNRPIFVDKLPNNWFYIDAILAMLPGARIVIARRDPLETCFACYRQRLPNEYSRSFVDLARFWEEFDLSARAALTRHARSVYECIHEHLLADTEAQIRDLLDFCGLPFDPNCLAFHQTRREVRSPSAMQVRQPLRRDTARTTRYGALLDPLRQALGFPRFDSHQKKLEDQGISSE